MLSPLSRDSAFGDISKVFLTLDLPSVLLLALLKPKSLISGQAVLVAWPWCWNHRHQHLRCYVSDWRDVNLKQIVVSLYVHVPLVHSILAYSIFAKTKCWNSGNISTFIDKITGDLKGDGRFRRGMILTIFISKGMPSHLIPPQLECWFYTN